jgi:hypothetical protein
MLPQSAGPGNNHSADNWPKATVLSENIATQALTLATIPMSTSLPDDATPAGNRGSSMLTPPNGNTVAGPHLALDEHRVRDSLDPRVGATTHKAYSAAVNHNGHVQMRNPAHGAVEPIDGGDGGKAGPPGGGKGASGGGSGGAGRESGSGPSESDDHEQAQGSIGMVVLLVGLSAVSVWLMKLLWHGAPVPLWKRKEKEATAVEHGTVPTTPAQ